MIVLLCQCPCVALEGAGNSLRQPAGGGDYHPSGRMHPGPTSGRAGCYFPLIWLQ